MEEKKYCSMQLCENCARNACPLIDEEEIDMDKDRSVSRLRHHAHSKEKTLSKEIKSYASAQKAVKDKKQEKKEKREKRRY